MLFESFGGGPFMSEVTSSDRRKMFVYDGCSPYQCEAAISHRFLLEVYLLRNTEKWSQQQRDYLGSLGFRLPPVAAVVAPSGVAGGSGTCATSGARASTSMVSKPFDRILVEGCCDPGSLLQRKTRFSRGCRVVQITEDDDFA